MLRISALASDIDTKAEGTRSRWSCSSTSTSWITADIPGNLGERLPVSRPGCPRPGLLFHGTTTVFFS